MLAKSPVLAAGIGFHLARQGLDLLCGCAGKMPVPLKGAGSESPFSVEVHDLVLLGKLFVTCIFSLGQALDTKLLLEADLS